MSKNGQESHSQEQRGWVRLECLVPVHYRIDSENTFKAGLASDISEGGVKFEANKRIPLQAVLRLAIQLPSSVRPLKVKAKVVSVHEAETNGSYKIGARFLDIKEKVRSRISRYIDEITSDIEEEEEEDENEKNMAEVMRILEEKGSSTVPGARQGDLKKKKEVDVSALTEEIESLEITIDEEKKICHVGKLAVLPFRELDGCPPLMLGLKFREAVMEPLLGKHGLKEEEIKEVMERCKKKFKSLGTRYYIHAINRKEQ